MSARTWNCEECGNPRYAGQPHRCVFYDKERLNAKLKALTVKGDHFYTECIHGTRGTQCKCGGHDKTEILIACPEHCPQRPAKRTA